MTRKFFHATKVMCVFYWVAYIQLAVLDFKDNQYNFSQDIYKTLLKFDVFFFYYSILSMMICLFISRFVPFQTLRERTGYGLNIKHKKDFLMFAKDDIPYFIMAVTVFMMSLVINNV